MHRGACSRAPAAPNKESKDCPGRAKHRRAHDGPPAGTVPLALHLQTVPSVRLAIASLLASRPGHWPLLPTAHWWRHSRPTPRAHVRHESNTHVLPLIRPPARWIPSCNLFPRARFSSLHLIWGCQAKKTDCSFGMQWRGGINLAWIPSIITISFRDLELILVCSSSP
jgi:hypothetical protein